VKISNENLSQLQENLVRSHACGTGNEVPQAIVKLMLLLKIQSLSYGYSGVQLETVERLTKKVRIQAKYHRSLEVIRRLKDGGMRTKSGIMLGLGEEKEEVLASMQSLVENGCDVLTLGQYLQPTPKHLPVARFVHPDEFEMFREEGYKMGFDHVESGPLVRSSYHAEKHLKKN
jgi:lipoate synthase